MNIAELNLSGIGTGDIKLDDKVDIRICFASEIHICDMLEPPRGFGSKGESKNIYLQYTVVYIPVLQLYFAKWDLRGDYEPPPQYRSIVKSWGGGLWVTIQATEHLQEAIKFAVARLLSGEYHINTKGHTIIPNKSLIQEFKDAGWIEPTPETIPSGQ